MRLMPGSVLEILTHDSSAILGIKILLPETWNILDSNYGNNICRLTEFM